MSSYIERNCDIYGRLGSTVYRRKRSGEAYSYEYVYKPKYEATSLSRRADMIMRTINTFTNRHQEGFKTALKKLYYYTPYFVYAGSYKFTCNNFFKLRQKDEYALQINDGLKQKQKLAPRTKVEYDFEELGEYLLKCYHNGELYSQRQVIVIDDSEVLEDVYAEWFEEYLTEVLEQPEPDFTPLKRYFRHIVPHNLMEVITGKSGESVLYTTSDATLANDRKFMYARRIGSYEHNQQSRYFLEVQPRVISCWKDSSQSFGEVWAKYYHQWFRAENQSANQQKATTKINLWSKVLFAAGKNLEFDLTTLSKENWLPGIATLSELLGAAGLETYYLSEEDLQVSIF